MPISTRTLPSPPTRVLHPRASSSTIDIPSSTVISIGLGFVAFAVTVLSVLVLLRIIRTMRYVRRLRAEGHDITFHSQWREEGGFFGFLTGLGSESFAAGGGAVADLARIRQILEEREREAKLVRPVMYEVEVPAREKGGHEPRGLEPLHPLAASTSSPPPYRDRSKPADSLPAPAVYISLLIQLPSDPSVQRQHDAPDDDEILDDLPELIVGSTTLIPVIQPVSASAGSSSSADSVDKIGIGEVEGKGDNGAEVRMVETVGYRGKAGRTARWEKADAGKWRIEGMG